MAGFFERLSEDAKTKSTLLCVGLDPHEKELPEDTPAAAQAFCEQLIEATHEVCCCYKPNAAFFEQHGPAGVEALHAVIKMCQSKGVLVLLDAKRGDIGSTSEAYARAAYEAAGADALTASPYMGEDSMEPLLRNPKFGVFMLCRTSNPGSKDIQSLTVCGEGGKREKLYEQVAALGDKWNKQYGNVGLVVGATAPAEMAEIRSVAPTPWILAPGVGFQGGDLGATVRAAVRRDGLGLLLPVSRGISRAKDPKAAAIQLRDQINAERDAMAADAPAVTASAHEAWSPALRKLADSLLEVGCVKFGSFTLKSGLTSPIYVDLRRPVAYPKLLAQMAEAFLPLLQPLEFKHIAALPYAAMPIASAISLLGDYSMVYPRKESKAYGLKADVEGVFEEGDMVVVIDDLITTGDSKFEGFEKLQSAGLKTKDVVVLIDRESGGKQLLASKGYNLHTVFNFRDLLAYWHSKGSIDDSKMQEVEDFLVASVEK